MQKGAGNRSSNILCKIPQDLPPITRRLNFVSLPLAVSSWQPRVASNKNLTDFEALQSEIIKEIFRMKQARTLWGSVP